MEQKKREGEIEKEKGKGRGRKLSEAFNSHFWLRPCRTECWTTIKPVSMNVGKATNKTRALPNGNKPAFAP